VNGESDSHAANQQVRPPFPGGPPAVIFFDKRCGLCTRAVRSVAEREPEGRRFEFAPIGGDTHLRLIGQPRPEQPDSVLVLDENGRLFTRWAAVRLVLWRLGGGSSCLATVMGAVPRALGDRLYDAVARFRATHLGRRLFGSCPLPRQPPGDRFSS